MKRQIRIRTSDLIWENKRRKIPIASPLSGFILLFKFMQVFLVAEKRYGYSQVRNISWEPSLQGVLELVGKGPWLAGGRGGYFPTDQAMPPFSLCQSKRPAMMEGKKGVLISMATL